MYLKCVNLIIYEAHCVFNNKNLLTIIGAKKLSKLADETKTSWNEHGWQLLNKRKINLGATNTYEYDGTIA